MKLIIDIPDDVYEDIEHDKGDYINYYINSLNWAVRNGIPYEERPQGKSFRIEEGLKKARNGNYVIYDVDFLLDNLAREVNIMESARQWKVGKDKKND